MTKPPQGQARGPCARFNWSPLANGLGEQFMSRFAFIIAPALAVSAASALAEDKMVVDMRKMTCAQLTKLGFQDFAGLPMWLSGYYNASRRNMVIDLEQFARAATRVKNASQANPRATVLATTERALGIKLPR